MNNISNWIGTWDWGNVADWVSGVGTILAILVSAWLVFYQIKTSDQDAKDRFLRERNISILETTEKEIIKIGYKIDLVSEKLNQKTYPNLLVQEIERDFVSINIIYLGGYVDKEKTIILRVKNTYNAGKIIENLRKTFDKIEAKNNLTLQDIGEIDKQFNELLINIVKIKTNILRIDA